MLLDLLRLSRAVGEASSGKLSGKLNLNIPVNEKALRLLSFKTELSSCICFSSIF